jgi:hypothetical protein
VFYAATRKLVLNGADGVVFVADAQRARRDANVEALNGAIEHLQNTGVDLERFPMVFQYNKQDLSGLADEDTLQRDLNRRNEPHFLTVATQGTGVLDTLRAAVRSVVGALNERTGAMPTERPYAVASPNSAIARQLAELSRASSPGLPRSLAEIESSRRPVPARAEPEPTADSTIPPEGEVVLLEDEAETVSNVDELRHAELSTERPVAGVSFSTLWEASQREPVELIESCISQKRYHDAVHHTASVLGDLLTDLPVPADLQTSARALLLGLDNREYLRLCRLASQPKETIRRQDALFALYLLVAARIKHTG